MVQKLQDTGVQVNVETHTALLKGFAHAGMMHKGAALFREICAQKGKVGSCWKKCVCVCLAPLSHHHHYHYPQQQSRASFVLCVSTTTTTATTIGKRNRPNVRTLNTLLRGCLWNATAIVQTNERGDFSIAGGVVTSRQAWQQLCQDNDSSFGPDSSSYEYFVAQLCYALCLDQAQDTVRKFQESFQVRENNNDDASLDPALLESLALCLLAMARGMAVLGQFEKARSMAKRAIAATTQASLSSMSSDTTQQRGIKGAKGGTLLHDAFFLWQRAQIQVAAVLWFCRKEVVESTGCGIDIAACTVQFPIPGTPAGGDTTGSPCDCRIGQGEAATRHWQEIGRVASPPVALFWWWRHHDVGQVAGYPQEQQCQKD